VIVQVRMVGTSRRINCGTLRLLYAYTRHIWLTKRLCHKRRRFLLHLITQSPINELIE